MASKEYYERLKEGSHLEFKKASNKVPDSLYETYSAFANTQGGIIYLGIEERKDNNLIQGVINPDELVKNLFTACHNPNKVSADLLSQDDILIVDVEGKKIIEIHVPEASDHQKPVYINNKLNQAYKRKADGDMLLSQEEIYYYMSKGSLLRKDMQTNTLGISVNALCKETLHSYQKEFISNHGDNSFKEMDDETFLRRIGALVLDRNNQLSLTNGAILFFGYYSDILRIYPNFHLDYRRYDDTQSERWSKRISSDDFSFSGNIYDFFNLVKEDIRHHLPNPFYRQGATNLDGKDIFEACMEAVANTLANAEYTLSGGITLVLKANSFTLTNSGRMGVTLQQAMNGGVSKPYNESIMNFFRFINVVEKAGSGIPKILDVAKRYQFLSPIIKEDAENMYTQLVFSFMPLAKNTPSASLKEKIIALLSEGDKEMSTSEIASALQVGKTQVIMACRELEISGFLKDNGKARKGRKLHLEI